MRWTNFNHMRLLRYAGLFSYLCMALPLLQGSWTLAPVSAWWSTPKISGWIVSYLLFGVTYLLLTSRLSMVRQSERLQPLRLLGMVVLTASAISIGWFSQSGLSAMLMLVIAVVLPWQLPLAAGLGWMLAQNLLLIPVIAGYKGWTVVQAILQVSIYLGISALTFFTSMIASQQAEEREMQRRLNSELRATRALLAESTRIAERMRIARDLHDLIGHHLTALSLNLEVASHLSNPEAADHVRKAQATAKHLLSDVREAVSELRQDDAIDLTQALRSLIEGVPGLNVHVETPPRFSVEDPRRAQVLLRCAQEIITNTARHAGARNLWLSFAYDEAGKLELHARDDGRGADQFKPGNGLSGMRERLAEFGGTVAVDTASGHGFALNVSLPLGEEPALAHATSRFEPPALTVS
ncbi:MULTISPECIES: sensor histidine kinase [Dyella]|uniref:Sensor histidine kinase n=2 Tax=Dyella TaxID=231454 RepID=A0A4R0YVZ1_9GAMM|nr:MULTISPECIES: sensor histidine kinase [Dyella]TBR38796.1 sensor histidine kinase [Dyella terrae]TCI13613.1 sensor histidine kinase [Dyella soli]